MHLTHFLDRLLAKALLICIGLYCSVSFGESVDAGVTPLFTPTSSAIPQPTQIYRLHIGKCHLDRADAGWIDRGTLEVRIVYSCEKKLCTWTTYESHRKAQGHDYVFNADVELPIDYDAMVSIAFRRRGAIMDDKIFAKECAIDKLRASLAEGRVTVGKSWIEVKIVDPPGRYEVTLKRTLVAPDDFVAIGGTLPTGDLIMLHEVILQPLDTFKKTITAYWEWAKLSVDKCDHKVVVAQNGHVVFDSSSVRTPQGLGALWNTKFHLNWTPGDRLEVYFLDVDVINNDLIFKESNSHNASIAILQGPLYGGVKKQSAVLFSACYIGP